MLRISVTLLCLGSGAFFSSAAQAALLAAKADTVRSAVLGQERAIEVSLPEESTQDAGQRFETLYVLDGDWNAKLVIQVAEFLRQLRMIPPIIVVSVPNYIDGQGINSRDRDLTPTSRTERPHSGGARLFLDFIKTELVPYVDQHYPTNRIHLIHGHSFGGVFLIYTLVNEPQLFDGYVVLDPALWWDKPWLEHQVADALTQVPPSGKALFAAGRAGEDFTQMGVDSLETVLKTHAPLGLAWRVVPYEKETHDSLKLKATYDGLRFLFNGYSQDPIVIHPELGTLIPGHPLQFVAQTPPGVYLHFTTDGTAPSSQSPEYRGPIGISDPDKLRFKLITQRGDFDQEVPVTLVAGKALAPLPARFARKEDAHWRYELYPSEAKGPKRAGRPLVQGTVDSDLVLQAPNQKTLSGRLERVLDIPGDGYYVFFVDADQAHLALNGKELFTTDGGTHHRSRSYVAPLRRGRYVLTIGFQQSQENSGFQVAVLRCRDEAPEWWKEKPWLHLDAH